MGNTYRSPAAYARERPSGGAGSTRAGFLALAASSLTCLAGGCSTAAPMQAQNPVAALEGFGMSREHAIEVCQTPKWSYFRRLRCLDGSRTRYTLGGDGGRRHDFPAGLREYEKAQLIIDNSGVTKLPPGAIDYHDTVTYSVSCGASQVTLYFDLQHCEDPEPTQAPAGFKFVD